MPTYLYKSKTGQTVNIYNHIVTVHPGLEFPAPNAILDAYIGVTLARYTDGEEDATATTDFVTAQTDAAGNVTGLVGPDGGRFMSLTKTGERSPWVNFGGENW